MLTANAFCHKAPSDKHRFSCFSRDPESPGCDQLAGWREPGPKLIGEIRSISERIQPCAIAASYLFNPP
jgi:hypothetical protein